MLWSAFCWIILLTESCLLKTALPSCFGKLVGFTFQPEQMASGWDREEAGKYSERERSTDGFCSTKYKKKKRQRTEQWQQHPLREINLKDLVLGFCRATVQKWNNSQKCHRFPQRKKKSTSVLMFVPQPVNGKSRVSCLSSITLV